MREIESASSLAASAARLTVAFPASVDAPIRMCPVLNASMPITPCWSASVAIVRCTACARSGDTPSHSYNMAAAANHHCRHAIDSVRRGRRREQIGLRLTLPNDLDRTLELHIVIELATLGRRIAEGETRDPVAEEAVDLARCAIVQPAIHRDAGSAEALVQLVAPLLTNGEVGFDLSLELERVVVERDIKLLRLRCHRLHELLLGAVERVGPYHDVRRDPTAAIHHAAGIALERRPGAPRRVGLHRIGFVDQPAVDELALLLNRPPARCVPLGRRQLERPAAVEREQRLHETLAERRRA